MARKPVKQGSRPMTPAEHRLWSWVNGINSMLDNETNDLLHECHAYIPDRKRVVLILLRIAQIAITEARNLELEPTKRQEKS